MRHIIEVSQIIEFPDGKWKFIKYFDDLPVIPQKSEGFRHGWISGAVTEIFHEVENSDDGEEIFRTHLLLEISGYSHSPFSKDMVEQNDVLKRSADQITNITSSSEIKQVYLTGEKPIFSEYY